MATTDAATPAPAPRIPGRPRSLQALLAGRWAAMTPERQIAAERTIAEIRAMHRQLAVIAQEPELREAEKRAREGR